MLYNKKVAELSIIQQDKALLTKKANAFTK